MGESEYRINDIFRIDYPRPEDRVANEPLGIYLKLSPIDGSKGLRMNIDGSAGNIMFSIESFKDLQEFVRNIYGCVTIVDEESELGSIKGSAFESILLGFADTTLKESDEWVAMFGFMIGVQIVFSENDVLTFFSDGEEGNVTLELGIEPEIAPHENIVWKKQVIVI